MNKYAYVTLLSTEDYLLGVLVCHWSWKQTQSPYPFICLVTDNICSSSINILKLQGIEVINIEKYVPNSYRETLEKMSDDQVNSSMANKDFNQNGWHNCWSKLCIFKLIQYDKVIYIDSDTWFWRNMDELFEKPFLTAVRDYNNKLCAGLLVIEPSIEEWERVTRTVEEYPLYPGNPQKLTNDQEVINITYDKWYEFKDNILPDYYHKSIAFLNYADEDWLSYNIGNIKALHIMNQKPWLVGKELVKIYRDSGWTRTAWIVEGYLMVCNTVIKELKNKGVQRFWEYF